MKTVESLSPSRGGSERRNHTLKNLLGCRDARTACRFAMHCGFRVARLHRLAALAFLVTTASSADAANPYPVPAGARSVALAYRPQWIEAAKRNPVFYDVSVGMDVEKVEVLDGYVNVMVIGPDVVRFAKSGKLDPLEFASRLLYEFPMMVEGAYVGSVIVRSRVVTDADSLGDFVFSGIRAPKGSTQQAVDRVGGFTRSQSFSVLRFSDESFAGTFLRLAADDGIQFVPMNPEAETIFSAGGNAISLPADRALPLIRTRILDRARE